MVVSCSLDGEFGYLSGSVQPWAKGKMEVVCKVYVLPGSHSRPHLTKELFITA